ncbi:steroid receptor-associated and regulated protein [Rhynchonycteris naso]
MGLETDLETSSGGKPAHQKAEAHLIFVINCAHGKQLSLAASPKPPQALSSNLGYITLPMKTFILFCEESQPHMTQEAPGWTMHCLGKWYPATLQRYCGPSFLLNQPTLPSKAPEAEGSPSNTVPLKSLAWGTVMSLLKAFSSCDCGQAD